MQFLGGKLSAAQLQVTGWVGSVRRSFQGALDLVWGHSEEKQHQEEDVNDGEEEESGGKEGRFKRAMSPLQNFARRSRRSTRQRSDKGLQKRAAQASSEQLNSRKNADQDVDALTHQTHQQNGICEQTSEIRRFKPISDHIPPDVSPEAHEEPDLPLLPESSTTLLDTSAQKSKAQLGRTRNRARPTRSLRAKPDKNPKLELRVTDYSDTTEISTEHRQSDSEEEKPKPNIYPSPSSQRVAAVPGVKPAVLIAQLQKKGIGKVDMEAEEKRPKEEKTEEAAPPALSRSPRLRVPPAGAALVLPPLGDNDGSTKQSPAWLQELKSKKRISQLESA